MLITMQHFNPNVADIFTLSLYENFKHTLKISGLWVPSALCIPGLLGIFFCISWFTDPPTKIFTF